MSVQVSIVTPCYNASKYIKATYDSVKSQTCQDWEWIIVDDQSQDGSWEILTELSRLDNRIRLSQNPVNSGPSVSRNSCLDMANGNLIAFLDMDDYWLPNKLEVQIDFMQSRNLPCSCHAYYLMSESGKDLGQVQVPPVVTMNDIRSFNPLATSFMMIRRSVIDELRFDIKLRRRQDWIFWYQILKKVGKCENLEQKLGKYRKDSVNSISKNKFHMAILQWGIYREYFKLNILQSMCSFFRYAVYGIKKHFFYKN